MPFPHYVRVVLAAALATLAVPGFAASAYDDDFNGTTLDTKWNLTQFQVDGDLIGAPTVAGGTLTFASGGNDFWGGADSGSLIGQKLSGSFIATVKVDGLPNVNEWSKTGLTLRDSFDPGASNASVMTTGLHGLTFQRRFEDQGSTTEVQPGGGFRSPIWLGLARYKTFAWPMASYDGQHWAAWDAGEFAFSDQVVIGIFVTAATGSDVTTAKLSQFRVQTIGADKGVVAATVTATGGSLPPYPAWVTVTDASGNEVGGSPTAKDGKAFVINVPPGQYQVSASKQFYDPSPAQAITVKAGEESAVQLAIAPHPSVGLDSATLPKTVSDGWKSKTDTDSNAPISWYDLAPAQPDTALDGTWAAQDVPGAFNAPDWSLFWYRLDFQIPPDWNTQFADRDLGVGDYNVDDSERTFVNGQEVGARWGDCCRPRWYTFPRSLLRDGKSDTLAIQGFQINGGAGFSDDGRYYAGTDAHQVPTLYVSDPTTTISGKVSDAAGAGQADVPMELWGSGVWGQMSRQTFTDATGAFHFYGLPKGSYSVVRVMQPSLLPDETEVRQVAVAGGRGELTQDFAVTARPSVWLIKENGFDWLSMVNAADEDHSAAADSDDGFAPFEVSRAKGNWSQLGDRGTGGWIRLHIKFPDSWKSQLGQSDLELWNFNFGESDVAYFNGTQIGAMAGKPQAQRDYVIDKSLVNATGDNVIDIKGTGGGPGAFFLWRPVLTLLSGGATTPVKGDLNGDGKVNIADATMALQFAVGNGTPSAAQLAAGDVVGSDGKIGIPDVTKILQAAIGAITL